MTQVGFCVISPWSLSRFLSNHKKALLRWLLHLHINFQLIPQRSLPCRRDRPSTLFTQIIGHNSVNVHRIPTKVGTQIRLNEPFKCAKFQPDPSTHSCFMADVSNVRNEEVEEEKKRRNQNEILFARISEMAGAIFFKFGV